MQDKNIFLLKKHRVYQNLNRLTTLKKLDLSYFLLMSDVFLFNIMSESTILNISD